MAEARRIGPEGDAKNLPELLQLGERRSAALLALALERIGAPAFVRQARDLGLTAEGSFTEARLTGLNTPQLLQDLKDHDIVVMPGFVAIGEKDRAVLLDEIRTIAAKTSDCHDGTRRSWRRSFSPCRRS